MKIDEKVYKKLLQVPTGKVTTYSELAKAVGLKDGQRIIGKIMNKNPYPVIVPCHRVVKANGEVGGYAFGEDVKISMLLKEGIEIKNKKIFELKKRTYRF
ncbi:MAG: MGMT family protein [Thaumarchaeota archaeon]|nr:MAG: Methylated-DNA--protein-cysteine methyltransferase [Nitrosopumilales archaeon]MCZ6582535.1 MGMT family protein [Nitrososphaerota archaeon]GFN40338.1 MAG: methylated-DNA--protein-cysteine methyltransferase [Marine Group I thaumarchaeote]